MGGSSALRKGNGRLLNGLAQATARVGARRWHSPGRRVAIVVRRAYSVENRVAESSFGVETANVESTYLRKTLTRVPPT